MKIAIFGSAFNPPTRGHADAIASVLNYETPFQKVLLVPSYAHAFAKNMLDYPLRVAMLNEFVSDLNEERVEAFAVEHVLAESKVPIYSYDLLEYLQSQVFPDDELVFVIGPDNKKNWHKFYKADEIAEKWQLLVVPERKAIRSTLVRNNVRQGNAVEELITPGVGKFIEENKLYV